MARFLAAVLAVFLFVPTAMAQEQPACALTLEEATESGEQSGYMLHAHLEQDEAQDFMNWAASKNGTDPAQVGAIQLWGNGPIGYLVFYDTTRCFVTVLDGPLPAWQAMLADWRRERA